MKRVPLLDRAERHILRLVDVDCWFWIGALNQRGYGSIGIVGGKAKSALAHRAIYGALRGPVNDTLDIDHLCRNPQCVNPDHLEPVTHWINIRRGLIATKTHCYKNHPLSGDNVRILTWPNGWTKRQCRICERTNSLRYYYKKASANVV